MCAQSVLSPFSAGLATAVLAAAIGLAPTPAVASPEGPGNESVECKLPPQIHTLGRNMTYLAAGRLVHIPVSECKLRGGSWNGRGPGAYAGAGNSGSSTGPVGVTVGGEGKGGACPLQGSVSGLGRGSTLTVRSGPGTGFARLDRLASGTRVFLCDRAGDAGWVGIVYSNDGRADCGLSAPIAKPRAYAGACRAGWVRSSYLR
ncbi:MAG: SH3 domain-containing protein [Arenimonas sp.]